jgi:hypothetical protein
LKKAKERGKGPAEPAKEKKAETENKTKKST